MKHSEKGWMGLIVQLLILALLLLVLPAVVGNLMILAESCDERGAAGLLLKWLSGQFVLWAGFQLICVPMVLTERKFHDVVLLFSGYAAVVALTALIVCIHRRRKMPRGSLKSSGFRQSREEILLWMIFWGLLAYQLIQVVRMAYADGDDAFYVATSSFTEASDTMYQKLPYTGRTTTLDVRYGLAPFPVWIAFLARLSGMHAVSVNQVVLPMALIPMTYAVFYLLGRRLFPERDGKLPLFLVFTEVLVLFGDYSFQSVENFMIARSRQGKAALGSIVIPFVLFLMLLLCQKIKDDRKIPPAIYLALVTAAFAGCLCSTLGALLLCMMIGVMGLIVVFGYKRWKILFPLAACCMPCVCYALIYLIYG